MLWYPSVLQWLQRSFHLLVLHEALRCLSEPHLKHLFLNSSGLMRVPLGDGLLFCPDLPLLSAIVWGYVLRCRWKLCRGASLFGCGRRGPRVPVAVLTDPSSIEFSVV